MFIWFAIRFQQVGGDSSSKELVYEYFVETCRGKKIEGSKGELFCLGGKNDEVTLQTVQRHAVATAIVRGGYDYHTRDTTIVRPSYIRPSYNHHTTIISPSYQGYDHHTKHTTIIPGIQPLNSN
jgi:hypothetical protein